MKKRGAFEVDSHLFKVKFLETFLLQIWGKKLLKSFASDGRGKIIFVLLTFFVFGGFLCKHMKWQFIVFSIAFPDHNNEVDNLQLLFCQILIFLHNQVTYTGHILFSPKDNWLN